MFTFVSISPSSSGDPANEKSRRLVVRSHARRAGGGKQRSRFEAGFLESRKSQADKPQSFGQHVGIFKISTPTAKQKRLLQAQPRREQYDKPKNSSIGKDAKSSTEAEPHLQLIPSRGRIDPFSTLSVPIGLPQQKLLHFYDKVLTQGFAAFDPKIELISNASSDPAWLNATLSLLALHYALRLGESPSSDCLFYRGEALKLVGQRLTKDSRDISDATMGAVALLAHFDITIGAETNATVHMNGLEHIVELKGGLTTFKRNRLVQNLISWSDLLYSSAWDSQPRFQFSCAMPEDTLSPHCTRDFRRYMAHLEFPPGFNAKMREITQIIRHLSVTKNTTMNEIQRMEFSRCIYLAEYRLLTLFDDCPSTSTTSRNLRRSWQLATYLYLYLALRDVPLASKAEKGLVKRLTITLLENPEELLVMWKDNLYLLLWIMFIGGAATGNTPDRQYFVKYLVLLSSRLEIRSIIGFQDTLKKVMWLRSFCDPYSTELWAEVEMYNGL